LGGSLTGDPTASVGTTVPFLFGRGSDDTLFQWYFYNGAWYSRTLGGSLAGDPAVAGAPDTTPRVFGRNAANTLQQWQYANLNWQTAAAGGALQP
jgi:hypothetical protein